MKQTLRFRTWIVVSVLAVIVILVVTPVMAIGSMGIDWYVIGGGGGTATGGIYTLNGTIGQPVVGIHSSADHDLCSGFWCLVLEQFNVFLPLILRN
jgi:hypothetical protein